MLDSHHRNPRNLLFSTKLPSSGNNENELRRWQNSRLE
jgi:hypothetical protein